MKNIQLIFTLLIALGGAALCIFYYKDGKLNFNWEKITQWGEEAEYVPEEVQLHIPESGIQSNELAIRSLHALLDQHKGNFAFSPMSTEMMLRQLSPLSDATLVANIEGLLKDSSPEMPPMSNSPIGTVSLFVDKDLPLINNTRTEQLFRAPFAEDRTIALADINNYIAIDTRGAIAQGLSTDEIVLKTKLLGVSALVFDYKWIYPLYEDVEEKLSFFQDSISLPYKVSTVTTTAQLRYIKDIEYDAVALFYQSEDKNEAPTCLMIVMPKFLSIRDFGKSMTTESLSDIRRKLAEATPTMVELRMPSFELPPIPITQKELFSKLGCDALFTQNQSMPYLSQEDCVLENIFQVISYQVTERPQEQHASSSEQEQLNSSNQLIIDRPFFWTVGDLTTDAAPQLMGIIESLK